MYGVLSTVHLLENDMLNLTATDVINIVTVLANIIISFVTYNVCKKNNNRSDILNSLIILCDDCENNLSSYWQKTMPHNDRVLLASAIKTNMKKVRSLLLVLGKQYLSIRHGEPYKMAEGPGDGISVSFEVSLFADGSPHDRGDLPCYGGLFSYDDFHVFGFGFFSGLFFVLCALCLVALLVVDQLAVIVDMVAVFVIVGLFVFVSVPGHIFRDGVSPESKQNDDDEQRQRAYDRKQD